MFPQIREKRGHGGTDCGRRHVVHDVGKIRSVGAAVIAAGLALFGCASGGDEETPTTTTSSAAAGPINPWNLPIEQRPALFDPCSELPVEAVEQGLGGPVEPVQQFTRHQPGGLMACSWATEHAEINVLSTWKSRDQYLKDASFTVVDPEFELGGRESMRMLDATDSTERACLQVFFTERGATWLMLDLIDRFREFDGERFVDPCNVLEQVGLPIIEHLPKGNFK